MAAFTVGAVRSTCCTELQDAQKHGSIGLTKSKAFKCVFVHWTIEHFDWPEKSADEMFR